jgi:hypothetical protein
MDLKATLEFTSDTAGTVKFEVTNWKGEWTEVTKRMVTEIMSGMSGGVISTYIATANTGTYTRMETIMGSSETISATFTANIETKKLVAIETNGDGETDTLEFKLK